MVAPLVFPFPLHQEEWHDAETEFSKGLGGWILHASRAAVQGADVLDEKWPLAFSECEEELLVFAELNGICLKDNCRKI